MGLAPVPGMQGGQKSQNAPVPGTCSLGGGLSRPPPLLLLPSPGPVSEWLRSLCRPQQLRGDASGLSSASADEPRSEEGAGLAELL